MKSSILYLSMLFSITVFAQEQEKKAINMVLDAWHLAASEADFDRYFSLMTDAGVFLGTDATENWQNQEFRDFSRPGSIPKSLNSSIPKSTIRVLKVHYLIY